MVRMMRLRYSVRPVDGETPRYLSPDMVGLAIDDRCRGGDGGAETPWRHEVTLTNVSDATFQGVVRIDLPVEGDDPRFFLPGFMYGRNRGEAPLATPDRFPRMRDGETRLPASSWWMVRADRLANPCALAVSDGRVRGVSMGAYLVHGADDSLRGHEAGDDGAFAQYSGYTCSLSSDDVDAPTRGIASIGVTLGYENAPWLFVSSANIRPRPGIEDQCLILPAGGRAVVLVDVFDYEASDERAIIPALRTVYRRFHESPRMVGDPRRAVEDLAGAVSRDAWLPDDHMYAGFVFDRPSELGVRLGDGPYWYQKLGSSGWTNGMAAAAPMLASGLRLGDERMRSQALDCIDHIVRYCVNPNNGLPFDAVDDGVWSNHGWWRDRIPEPGHSAYLVGQMLYYVLQSYEYERGLGHAEHADWLDMVGGVVPRLAAQRNSDGEYPFIFSETTGAGLDYGAFAGAWCLAAGAYWAKVGGDMSDLDGLKASERHYHDAYVRHMECYGAPLDTSKAVDSEGVLAYVKATRLLHEITGDDLYLDHLAEALAYESTFRFCWNSPVTVPPLGRVGWSSCGGSVTSTCNPHIHPMSSNIIGDMRYYLDHREDDYVRSRMEDAVRWSCQTYNTFDGEYDYGKVGWMSERFCHSQGLLEERYEDGSIASTWFALMPWAIGAILDGLTGLYWDRCITHGKENQE
ncbi:hypothetical protein [Bifidobacterium lemurum]|nr:hypothetical protein [Bifidobacterium lemurum]QOL34634.1 hypothetical protein BL8807_01495 [Bifidobacterium lemurum]